MIFFSLKFNLISTVTKFLFYGAAVQAPSTAGTWPRKRRPRYRCTAGAAESVTAGAPGGATVQSSGANRKGIRKEKKSRKCRPFFLSLLPPLLHHTRDRNINSYTTETEIRLTEAMNKKKKKGKTSHEKMQMNRLLSCLPQRPK